MVDHTDHSEEGRRAAGYIRVSSANQDTQLSIAAQKEGSRTGRRLLGSNDASLMV